MSVDLNSLFSSLAQYNTEVEKAIGKSEPNLLADTFSNLENIVQKILKNTEGEAKPERIIKKKK